MRAGPIFIISSALLLAGCGERFPLGERLLPASYGPPFGSDRYRPHHAANPAGYERHAEFLAEESRSFGSHGECNAAMRTYLAEPGEHHGPVAISSIETVGHHIAGGVTHEYRCSDYTLSRRAWRSATGDAAHGNEERPAEH